MTGNALLTASMQAAGLLALGEPIDADSAASGRSILNMMLESWSNQDLTVFTLNRNIFNLVAGTASYTVGAGGTFAMVRPARIQYVTIIYNANPAQPLEMPELQMYSDAEWAAVPVKAIANILPQGVYDDGGFPLRTLTYWPVPTDSSVQTVIGGWAALTAFPANLGTDITFPPGYMEAIKYNLAIRLAAEWQGSANADVKEFARQGMALIKSSNVQEVKWRMDDLIGAGSEGGGRYDYRTDSYR